jgi:hypothetical protein
MGLSSPLWQPSFFEVIAGRLRAERVAGELEARRSLVPINASGGRMSVSTMKQTPVYREASLTSVENTQRRDGPFEIFAAQNDP